MKTIAQVLLSLVLSLAVTAGLNTNARGKIEQALQTAEAKVAQVTDFAAQTVSDIIVNANAQISTDTNAGASADSKNSASASVDANGDAGLSTVFHGLFGQADAGANADAQSSVSSSGDGSFLNFVFGGQGSSNLSAGAGK